MNKYIYIYSYNNNATHAIRIKEDDKIEEKVMFVIFDFFHICSQLCCVLSCNTIQRINKYAYISKLIKSF